MIYQMDVQFDNMRFKWIRYIKYKHMSGRLGIEGEYNIEWQIIMRHETFKTSPLAVIKSLLEDYSKA